MRRGGDGIRAGRTVHGSRADGVPGGRSIDAVAVADEKGRRYLVWKEDGNSRKRPTPLWAQPLSRRRDVAGRRAARDPAQRGAVGRRI